MRETKNLFVTGRPGVGKTTAVIAAVEALQTEVHGFTTEELREGRRRVGFRIEDMQGNAALMAHVEFEQPPGVSKYGVNVQAVERVGVRALRRALREGTPAIVDEVGRMELACEAFREILQEVVEADIPVLGTMHRHHDPVTDRIRGREDTRIINITRENRDGMPDRLVRILRGAVR